MRFEAFSFGSICIDGITHEHDVLIDRGQVRKRKKKASKKFCDGTVWIAPDPEGPFLTANRSQYRFSVFYLFENKCLARARRNWSSAFPSRTAS